MEFSRSTTQGNQFTMTAEVRESQTAIEEVFRGSRQKLLERVGKVAYDNKADGSEVTDTDREIEEELQRVLASRCPGLPVYGEEAGYDEDNLPALCWLVDPIDGTKAFVQNEPTFTCMAVLIQNGEAVLCMIYNPSTDDMFTAQKGGGAYKNGVRLDLSAVPLSRVGLCKGRHIEALNDILQPQGIACEIAPNGGGFGFTMVAEGLAAARFNLHSRGYVHDYAPGGLLVREAGGELIPIKEDAYTFKTRSFVACHPALAALIRERRERVLELEN